MMNVAEDEKEQINLIKNVLEGLKPWLNLELYKHVEKFNAQLKPGAMEAYLKYLKEHGASEEELAEAEKKFKEDSSENISDEAGSVEVISLGNQEEEE